MREDFKQEEEAKDYQNSTEDSTGSDDPTEQYDQTETYFIKLSGDSAYDMKIEHFDDLLQDSSVQTSWAGLDSTLIDEEFLYLEDEEADRIYKELKQRQFRRRNMEESEMRINMRMKELEALAEQG